jgi:hypothetical protein
MDGSESLLPLQPLHSSGWLQAHACKPIPRGVVLPADVLCMAGTATAVYGWAAAQYMFWHLIHRQHKARSSFLAISGWCWVLLLLGAHMQLTPCCFVVIPARSRMAVLVRVRNSKSCVQLWQAVS